ncbi:DUF4404 family protein [Streptomyces sp. NPDC002181]|uniref:DUF4404 family protein n=1 Tax=Streptomyces sp. NPDC002181 TaxID=3364635 RepID=UPI003682410A
MHFLHAHLTDLDRHVAEASIPAGDKEVLRTLARTVADHADSGAHDKDALAKVADDVRSAAFRYEASHPRIAATLSSLAQGLLALGI